MLMFIVAKIQNIDTLKLSKFYLHVFHFFYVLKSFSVWR